MRDKGDFQRQDSGGEKAGKTRLKIKRPFGLISHSDSVFRALIIERTFRIRLTHNTLICMQAHFHTHTHTGTPTRTRTHIYTLHSRGCQLVVS